MLCSAKELGFADASNGEGIIILELTSQPGLPLKDALGLNDAVLHLSLTPNRGDCFSIIGVAVELAASLNFKMKPASKSLSTFQSISIPTEVVDTTVCTRYTLHKIQDIQVRPSSSLIKQRLEKSGVRSINNIVDFTNYMMLERGQPMHAFDADKVTGKIQVRMAKEGESILCLDGEKRDLLTTDLVIADDQGPIGIAGVMGGQNSSITNQTKNIFLESALFHPKNIRMTSRRLNLITESSKRFEREVDPTTVLSVAMFTAGLIEEFASGKIIGGVDFDHSKTKGHKINLTSEKIEQVLGIKIPNAGEYLSRLGFSLEKMGEGWMVEVPPRRPEILREIDLIEEVARIHGYNNIPSSMPIINNDSKVDSTFGRVESLRQRVIGLGLQEAKTYSFSSPKAAKIFSEDQTIEIENPLTPEISVMRTSLLPGLLDCWKHNQAHQCEGVRLFEIGKTFFTQKDEIQESLKLAAVWAGNIEPKLWFRQTDRLATYYDGKGFLDSLLSQYRVPKYQLTADHLPSFLHPGQSVTITIARKDVGYLGMLHPSVCRELDLVSPICVLEMDLTLLLEMGSRKTKFVPFSSFPKIERDMAFIVPMDVKHENIVQEINHMKIPFLLDTYVFDRFKGGSIPKGSVSLAYRFVFHSSEKTLTDQEVEQATQKIANYLKAKFEATVRS